jgi:hypothetical protein
MTYGWEVLLDRAIDERPGNVSVLGLAFMDSYPTLTLGFVGSFGEHLCSE